MNETTLLNASCIHPILKYLYMYIGLDHWTATEKLTTSYMSVSTDRDKLITELITDRDTARESEKLENS